MQRSARSGAGDGLPFIRSCHKSPDVGLGIALKHLGYELEHLLPASLRGTARLADLLQSGPVLVDPVDMGKIYIPNHQVLHGVDHYVCSLTNGQNEEASGSVLSAAELEEQFQTITLRSG